MRILLTMLAVMAMTSASAQGFRVYLKGGMFVDYPANTVDHIEFYPAEDPSGPDDPSNPDENEDKSFLEETGIAFLNQIKADDFRNVSEIISHIQDYNTDALDDWGDECLEAVKTALGSHTETESYSWGNYVTVYTDYKWLLRASSFTGHFVAQNGYWKKAGAANDLQFTFTDKNGATCVAKIVASGSKKTVHIVDNEDYQRYYNNADYIDNNKIYVEFPEHITATFQQGSQVLVTINVDFDLSTISGEEWDLSRNGLGVSMVTKVNGYEVNMSRMGYQPASGAFVELSVKKSGTVLLSAKMMADMHFDYSSTKMDEEQEFDWSKQGAANAEVDIMGRVQIKSHINSIEQLKRALDNANKNEHNESDYRRYVNNANAQMSTMFYYNGGATSKGTITLEPFLEDEWNGREYWGMKPILTFVSDNSSYAFDTYFTESGFQGFLDTYKNLIDDFEYMFESVGLR